MKSKEEVLEGLGSGDNIASPLHQLLPPCLVGQAWDFVLPELGAARFALGFQEVRLPAPGSGLLAVPHLPWRELYASCLASSRKHSDDSPCQDGPVGSYYPYLYTLSQS